MRTQNYFDLTGTMSILPGMRDFNNGHAAHKPYTLKDRGGPEATPADLGHGIVNEAHKRFLLFSCYSVEHAPGENTEHNEPETVSCVSRRPLESAEVQSPPEPGPLSDVLFQNFGHSLLSIPSPSLSLSLPPSLLLLSSLSLSLLSLSLLSFSVPLSSYLYLSISS